MLVDRVPMQDLFSGTSGGHLVRQLMRGAHVIWAGGGLQQRPVSLRFQNLDLGSLALMSGELTLSGTTKMRTDEAAKYLRLAASTLAKLRLFGGGPIYAKAGARVVVYDRLDLERWLADRKRRSTTDSVSD